MGKYTARACWPIDLKIAAAEVARAKLERKWRKHNALACENTEAFNRCADLYIDADRAVLRAKNHFADLYCEFQNAGVISPL